MDTTALARLVGSVSEFDAVWGQAPLLVPNASGTCGADGWPDLLTLDGVDELLSVRGLRTPFLRMAKSGQTLAERRFTSGGGVGAGITDQVADDEVFRQFADGSTIVLQALHRNWPPVIAFAQDLAADLGHPVQVNAYITPPQSQGFAAHYDVHDVFILQLAGTKEWTVHAPVHRWPMRDEPWDGFRAAVEQRAAEDPLLSAVLRPGDCLYLPRGFLHSAVAQGEVSAHLTLGVHTWTSLDVTRTLVDAAMASLTGSEAARAPLPLGVAVDDPTSLGSALDDARERLLAALAQIDGDAIARRLAGRWRGAQRAEPVRPVALATAARELHGGSPLRRRTHAAIRRRARDDGSVRLLGRGVDVTVAGDDLLLLDRIPPTGDFTPASLTGDDAAGDGRRDDGVDAAVALCRRLMLAGVLLPAGPLG